MKKTVTNTTNEVNDNPQHLLLKLLVGGSNAILDQEAQGQKELANGNVIPTKFLRDDDDKQKKLLTDAGCKFLGEVPNDPLFQYVELPQGWKINPTDHAMWSDILDNKNRVRFCMFYKAAFYDRKAHIEACCRYHIQVEYPEPNSPKPLLVCAKDGDKTIFSSEPYVVVGKIDYSTVDQLELQVTNWMNENYPNWREFDAYWD